jgi:hypothetical protein
LALRLIERPESPVLDLVMHLAKPYDLEGLRVVRMVSIRIWIAAIAAWLALEHA